MGIGRRLVIDEGVGPTDGEILVVEGLPNCLGGKSPCRSGRRFLHHLTELDLEFARQLQAVILLHEIGDTALAGLAVDADHRLVVSAHVLRVDRQIGYRPFSLFACFIAAKPFLIAS